MSLVRPVAQNGGGEDCKYRTQHRRQVWNRGGEDCLVGDKFGMEPGGEHRGQFGMEVGRTAS